MNTLNEIKINLISVFAFWGNCQQRQKMIFQIFFWKWPILNETGKQNIYNCIPLALLWADYFLQIHSRVR